MHLDSHLVLLITISDASNITGFKEESKEYISVSEKEFYKSLKMA